MLVAILALILVLGVLIVVHELGHFVTAKLSGIAVPRFSIGLGPKIWGIRHGETEYVISALPLGGYVKMAGLGEEEMMEQLEGGPAEADSGLDEIDVPPERRFSSKSLPTRALVISAGVIMNFLFAVVAYSGLAYFEAIPAVVGEVQEESPAERAGLQRGDRILSVDGVEIQRWLQFAEYVRQRPGEEVQLRVQREGREIGLPAEIGRVPQAVDTVRGDTIMVGQIGIYVDTVDAERALGPGGAIVAGFREAGNISILIFDYVGQLLTGQASARNLGGPILIGQLSGQAARAGPSTLIRWMALLSVNLAILNLLPIPILDGGHLVFLTIEAVRGRALSLEARARLSQIGFVLILALMVWVITSDLLRLAGR